MNGHLLYLLRRRLALAVIWPGAGVWRDIFLLCLVFPALVLPFVLTSDWLTAAPGELSFATLLSTFFVPALAEELIFRVLLNPHPSEAASPWQRWCWGIVSLLLYVALHPLQSWLWRDGTVFRTPSFLITVALLGATCLLVYRRSGSVWPPVLIHWLVVSVWFAAGSEAITAVF